MEMVYLLSTLGGSKGLIFITPSAQWSFHATLYLGPQCSFDVRDSKDQNIVTIDAHLLYEYFKYNLNYVSHHTSYALFLLNFLTHLYEIIFFRWSVKNSNILQMNIFCSNFGAGRQRLYDTHIVLFTRLTVHNTNAYAIQYFLVPSTNKKHSY